MSVRRRTAITSVYWICVCYIFFFNDTATTEIYTLSLHDALPIWRGRGLRGERLHPAHAQGAADDRGLPGRQDPGHGDRKSTRLNSSHANISYAVFCLKKKTHI